MKYLILASVAVGLTLASPAQARSYQSSPMAYDNDGRVRIVQGGSHESKARQHRKAYSKRISGRTAKFRSKGARGHRDTVVAHNRSVRPRDTPREETWDKPGRYIYGRLVCAVNVGAELARRGIKGTGSALAKSYLRWGRPSDPVPGAVAVYSRGGPKSKSGHVAIVAKVVGNKVYVLNPGRRGWKVTVYRKNAIAYRVAG